MEGEEREKNPHGEDKHSGRRKKKRKNKDNKPFTKRRKHAIIQNPDSLDHLTEDALVKVMCKLDIKSLDILSRMNKRLNSIFKSPWFFRQCIEPYLSQKQLKKVLLKDSTFTFEHDTSDGESLYKMKVKGRTIEGIEYELEWFFNPNEYADMLYDNYEPEDNEEVYGGAVPKNKKKQKAWFRKEFEGEGDNGTGDFTITFPSDNDDYEHVYNRTEFFLRHFTKKFTRLLDQAQAPRGSSNHDSWYIEVYVEPFKIHFTTDAEDEVDLVKVASKELKQKLKNMYKKKHSPMEIEDKIKQPIVDDLIPKQVGFLASEVKSVLAEVESTSDMIGESSLKKSCKDYVEEARRLLEEINIEEKRDEEMIEKLNRVHGRLIMCLGYNVKY